jgi:AhpD family alkylhydroperoxidase
MDVSAESEGGESRVRIALVEEPQPPGSEVFAVFRDAGRPVSNLYKVLAHAPRLLKAWVDFAWPLRDASAPRGLRELSIVYLAVRRRCEYVAVHHRRFASRHGVADEQLEALTAAGWDREAPWTDTERTMLTLVDEVVDTGAASAETVARLQAARGAEQAVELVVTVAFYEAVCVVNRSFATPLETSNSG